MAADLAAAPHSGLTVQVGGDAHILNVGSGPLRLSRQEVIDMGLSAADRPHETTVSLIANAMFSIRTHPAELPDPGREPCSPW
ncbi:DUF2252 family protein [Micromonospora chokoriensis]